MSDSLRPHELQHAWLPCPTAFAKCWEDWGRDLRGVASFYTLPLAEWGVFLPSFCRCQITRLFSAKDRSSRLSIPSASLYRYIIYITYKFMMIIFLIFRNMIMNFKPPNHLEAYQQNFTVMFPFQLGFVLTVSMKGSHTWAGRLAPSGVWGAGVPGPACAQRSWDPASEGHG